MEIEQTLKDDLTRAADFIIEMQDTLTEAGNTLNKIVYAISKD